MKLLCGKRRSILLITAVLILGCLRGTAASARETTIFVVKSNNISSYNQALDGFKKNASADWKIVEYDLAGTIKNVPEMQSRLSSSKADFVLAIGAKALTAVSQAEVSIPSVFCAAINISRDDLRNPNITGVSLTASPIEQFQFLAAISPKIKTIGVLLRQKKSEESLKKIINSAEGQGIIIVPVELAGEKEIPQKLRQIINQVDAIWMLDDAYVHSQETLEFLIGTTIEYNLPFMAISEVFVEAGATVSLSPSFTDNGAQAAKLIEKMHSEAIQPREIPICYHQNPDLVLNLKIAKKIGLEIGPEVINRAKVIYK